MSTPSAFFGWVEKALLVLDPYERQARFFPAALALAPFFVMALAVYMDQVLSLRGLAGLLGTLGLVYLMADVARSQGKKHESRLWASWGGAPSVQVLRHRDSVFDMVTKKRYHAFLGKKLGLTFPTVADEAANPAMADAAYAAGGNWLRENTRDTKKFNLLFRANINYGFRRNGYGMRWVGLSICCAVVAWVLLRQGPSAWVVRWASAKTPETLLQTAEVATLLSALAMALLWTLYFSEARVREAAFSYAQRLIVACEAVSPKTSARAAPTEKATQAP